MVSWVSVSALLVVVITLVIMSTAEAKGSEVGRTGEKGVQRKGQNKNTARRKHKKEIFNKIEKSKNGKASKKVHKKLGKANKGRATKGKIEETKSVYSSGIGNQRMEPRPGQTESKFKHCDYLNLLEVGYRARSDFSCKAGDKFLFKVT